MAPQSMTKREGDTLGRTEALGPLTFDFRKGSSQTRTTRRKPRSNSVKEAIVRWLEELL
jgi:hypothetical protein